VQPFQYHAGQRAVQAEANSAACANKLATWVGPVADFARIADLIVMASTDGHRFRVGAISGPAPLVDATESNGNFVVTMPAYLADMCGLQHAWGGIVINLAQARRSRISGMPVRQGDHISMQCETAFTNCRKYMAPTASAGEHPRVGPLRTEALAFDDPWIEQTIQSAETAFLVTASPAGTADASHRGGFPGFLRYDKTTHTIAWTDYLGDGMFVSMGNVRSNGASVLVVLELATGDALRVDLDATYTNLRTDRHERVDALLQANEPYPVQGRVVALIKSAERLVGFCYPRVRVSTKQAITSEDTKAVQHPQ
jgi:hypothetical protein